MLQIYVFPTLQQRVCLQETIFMHDGVPPHNTSSVQQLLRQELTDVRVNSRSFQKQLDLHDHPISCLCDFWLWGFLKDNVYRERLTTDLDLKISIRRHKCHL
ncbi:uncharacterized protein TNIN_442641 [Trichonephila inaurata madagascariensis]|uniref:Uncharacterized protein n=1 Tax=Trichonephila inaurata madagascariensis TaxID=2747483 RepID=A0A8X7BTB0_9ARAC|nr:uncharacterized protein TNIN_442641 [Trichonephila inaurata madagascariensis]